MGYIMGIHDRDYVRNKEFDYKNMEYVTQKKSFNRQSKKWYDNNFYLFGSFFLVVIFFYILRHW
jgi:hypothetical protein